jgi:hypothetical protein
MGAPAGMDGNLRHGTSKEISRATRPQRAIRGCAPPGYYHTELARAAAAFGAAMRALVQWRALVSSPEFEIEEPARRNSSSRRTKTLAGPVQGAARACLGRSGPANAIHSVVPGLKSSSI